MSEPAILNPDIILPIVFSVSKKGRKLAPFVQVPVKMVSGTDTLNTNYCYMLDTGTPVGFAIINVPPKLDSFIMRHEHIEYENDFSLTRKNMRHVHFVTDVILKDYQFGNIKGVINNSINLKSDKYNLWFDNADTVSQIAIGGEPYRAGMRVGTMIEAINGVPWGEISEALLDSLLSDSKTITLSLSGDKVITLTAVE